MLRMGVSDILFIFWGLWNILPIWDFTNLYYFLQPEDFWFSAPKKGVMVFALPGEPGLTELVGDFKVQFHDRQGDFYLSVIQLHPNKSISSNLVMLGWSESEICIFFFFFLNFSWLNTTMSENRKVLNTNDLDGFDKVKIK